ncbi:MAG TPA: DNA mismatch repair protein MutS [Candidatus Cryptobacteroides sp.]|mgnify:CR=1 FL=1|nr:DNA mismatch repair protein MutS [Candidatus Cryptobacteroides sp.]
MAKVLEDTPMLKHYFAVKAKNPEAILLYRVGDFYEPYSDDAVLASKVLGIVLTHRANGEKGNVAMAGVPHHAVHQYIPKLVRAGYKVAICDQLEDPKLAKNKLVKRGITEILTPGVAFSEDILEQKEHNFLCGLDFEQGSVGAAFLDVSTGTFQVAQGNSDYIHTLIDTFAPKEIVVRRDFVKGVREKFGDNIYISPLDEWAFVHEAAVEKLCKQFSVKSLKGFGVDNFGLAVRAAGALIVYLEQTEHTGLKNICSISRIDESKFVWMDRFTFRNLEIFSSNAGKDGVSLVEVLDQTSSPMGARLLRQWLAMPIIDRAALNERYDIVEYFIHNEDILEQLRGLISEVGDLERILSRAATGRIIPREMVQLGRSLRQMQPIKDLCGGEAEGAAGETAEITKKAEAAMKTGMVEAAQAMETKKAETEQATEAAETTEKSEEAARVQEIAIGATAKIPTSLTKLIKGMKNCSRLLERLSNTMVENPAVQIGKGEVIAQGVNKELDDLRELSEGGKEYLLQMQQREAERTGIGSLKIGYNNVFGYYIEVRHSARDLVPPEWHRKQTLVNAERYITEELKEYEEKILTAEEKIVELESAIYAELISEVQKGIRDIQTNCRIIAQMDVLQSFARQAIDRNYCRPNVNGGSVLDIKAGRHPVIETLMPPGEEYVPNDIRMDSSATQIMILTGPNMSGKSALLRQTALIVLMAQIGSFVPADSADFGWFDKIFTRVGASDNISRGESTFMVEMLETAMIMHNLSSRSLVLLDEIGRGTSTYDGMSIARAIVEYIYNHGKGAKTLFATHYHELNDLEKLYPRVKNYHITVKELGKEVLFLRKLEPGGVSHSFGIHVARMAGMPREIVESAEATMKAMERREQSAKAVEKSGQMHQDGSLQLSLFQLDDPTLASIRASLEAADLNNITPMQAFDLLREMKKEIGLQE